MRNKMLALGLCLLMSATAATAKDFSAYVKGKLETAIASGAPVVVHVHAEWCPVCRRQVVLLDEVFKDPSLAMIQTVRVNYDTDLDFARALKVKQQANILAFKGGKEVARVDYSADPDRIRGAIDKLR